jgi:hypothetical protein
MIHKSFTKKDLLDFINVYDLPIDDPKQYSKNNLAEIFVDSLNGFDITWNNEYPDFFNNDDLLKYLTEQKSNEELNYREKSEMIQKAKKIINYCRNGFMISITDYLSIDQIYQEGIIVANHCDIPTCRRAIDELNNDPKIRNKIEKKISPKVKKTLEQKKINKDELTPKLQFHTGNYELVFD